MGFAEWIAILASVTALLAVFVSPFVQARLAEKQNQITRDIANKQLVGPLRQNWIDKLRDTTCTLLSEAQHHRYSGASEVPDGLRRELRTLEHRIALLLNPNEADHQEFRESVRQMVEFLEQGHEQPDVRNVFFDQYHQKTIELSQSIFKREWNRVKEPISH